MQDLLLDLRELTVRYPGAGHDALSKLELTLRHGERLAVLGPSGAGKSSLALALLGLSSATVSGTLKFDGEDVGQLTGDALRRLRGGRIGLVQQDPDSALHPMRRVESLLDETLAHHHPNLARDARRRRALDLLRRSGLDDRVLRSYGHQLSGGMRQRVALALALAPEPKLLIADEATASLDRALRRHVAQLFRDLSASGTAVLWISHDVETTFTVCERGVLLDAGRQVARGDVAALRQASPTFFSSPTPPPASTPGEVVVEIDRVSKTYAQGVRALDSFSGSVHAGEVIGLTGASGSGKTTLAKLLGGLETPDQGQIRIAGRSVDSWLAERQAFYRQVQMIFQGTQSALDPRRPVSDALDAPLRYLRNEPSIETRRHTITGLLADVGLEPTHGERKPDELSGGERQRINIARAAAAKPTLLIADEPTSALDPPRAKQVIEALAGLRRQGHAMLLVSHDFSQLRAQVDRLWILREGRLVAELSAAELAALDDIALEQRVLGSTAD